MSTSLKYVAYLTVLHLLLGVMAYFVIGRGPVLLLVEMILLLSAYLGYRLYQVLVAPLDLLSRGVGALSDQDFSIKMTPTGSPEMDRLGTVYNRMIDQLRTERVMGRQRQEFLDRLVSAAEVGIVILDFDGKVESENPWVRQLRGEQQEFVEKVIAAAPSANGVEEAGDKRVYTTADNRRIHVEYATFIDRGFERGFVVLQDVTADLLQAEKEAYGKVIRMMAHEVNNSNAAIVSLLKSLLEIATEKDPNLPEIASEYLPPVINRAENLTGFMRNFARVVRLPVPKLQRVDLNAILVAAGGVMQPLLEGAAIELTYQLDIRPLLRRVDPAQLEQVIINALTNARESIGEGGRIILNSNVDEGSITVADDGPGIPEEVKGNIFTPFFSTKSTGQGVGLTLSRDVLEAHGAQYQLVTEADGWTRFKIKLSN
ncbi:Signal transduction histidine-protein kinase AtoS [Neolewinella maritima]|uniref:histidine kinase n=1 Tax=Neolewinella maritima TaxID=1383882 RepID=A0ABM9B1R8_9BACT|nr:ATP-binding protein [Neolewinella maritima]CAH1001076.1 Signal transduction histidine-protein kinase AtoS [Neolewinella maritima]